jgi:hypothetical protein
MTEEELVASFENCTLPNESFHHADHVRMAFLYLCRYPALEALQRFSSSLTRFAAAHGQPDLYNETVMRLVKTDVRKEAEAPLVTADEKTGEGSCGPCPVKWLGAVQKQLR